MGADSDNTIVSLHQRHMPVQSRQQRIRENAEPTEDEMEMVRNLNAGRRLRGRRAREVAPDAYNHDYGDNNDDGEIAQLRDDVSRLSALVRRSITKQRPYYDVPSTRTTRLLLELNRPDITEEEKANIMGMLQVNRRYRWWKRRHPGQ